MVRGIRKAGKSREKQGKSEKKPKKAGKASREEKGRAHAVSKTMWVRLSFALPRRGAAGRGCMRCLQAVSPSGGSGSNSSRMRPLLVTAFSRFDAFGGQVLCKLLFALLVRLEMT